MWAMIVKEFRQLRRDRRTLAMMIVLPVVLLVVFGYAASFDVSSVPAVVAGPRAAQVPLRAPFQVVRRAPAEGATWAQDELRDGHAAVAVVTGTKTVILIDGSQLFTAKAALAALQAHGGLTGSGLTGSGPAGAEQAAGGPAPQVRVLYNPGLKTADIMIPAWPGWSWCSSGSSSPASASSGNGRPGRSNSSR